MGCGIDGRWIAGAIVAAFACGLACALQSGQPDAVWRTVGVFPMGGLFEDLYPFVAAQQTLALGQEIYAPMALEPWGRPYNYPVLWLTFMRFSETAIPYLGGGMIAAWFVALGLACGRLTLRQGWIVGMLSCSPAVVLTLERANTDVIIFCLVVASVALLGRARTSAAWAGLILATTLKLFPVFAFGSFFLLGWRRAWPWLVAGAVATAILCAIQHEAISAIIRETPKGGIFSYGALNWVFVVSTQFMRSTGIAGAFDAYHVPTIGCAVLLVGVAFVAGLRHPPGAPNGGQCELSLAYFWTGAGIFLATFLCGSHFVYRLVFLLLCVPWLARGSGADEPALVWGRRVSLGLIALGLWSNPYWSMKLFLVREIALWSLAAVLAWLTGRTLPAGFPGQRWRSRRAALTAVQASPG